MGKCTGNTTTKTDWRTIKGAKDIARLQSARLACARHWIQSKTNKLKPGEDLWKNNHNKLESPRANKWKKFLKPNTGQTWTAQVYGPVPGRPRQESCISLGFKTSLNHMARSSLKNEERKTRFCPKKTSLRIATASPTTPLGRGTPASQGAF